MASRLYRDEAVVLRTYRLGEADRIIVMLTRSHGQVRAVAKGVRRTTSRFGARLEPFSMVDVQLHRGRSLDVVAQVETLHPFARAIAGDYAVFTCASTMVETAERLTQDDGLVAVEPARHHVPSRISITPAGACHMPISSARQRSARLTAEMTALKEEVVIDGSMPTPHRTCPFTSHST